MKSSEPFCDLCGLPLRKQAFTLPSSDRTYSFCCNGCKQVFQMLAEQRDAIDPASFKESELFRKCRELGIIPGSEEELAKKENAYPGGRDEGIGSTAKTHLQLNLKVNGMWCPACAWVIEESLKKTTAISNVHCSFSSDRMRCDYDPVLTSPSRIRESLAGLGYDTTSPESSEEAGERKREIIRFALSAFLTMNVMMFSFALYAGFFTELSLETIQNLSWPIFVMASIVLFYGGRRIYQRAWAGVTSAAFSMETLITIGAFSAYVYSTYQLLCGGIHLYYDTACMLIVLATLGKFLESRAKDNVKQGLESLYALQPTKVKILLPGQTTAKYVSAAQLARGDLYQVEEGEIVPADGKILEGTATVDESSLTGEARPVTKGAGDDLRSGVRLIQGLLKVRAGKAVGDSTLSQLLSVLDNTLMTGEPLQGKTDRLLRWFVPLVIALAAGTGFVCLSFGLPLEAAVLRSLTVLVISCPCTLGIAVPLTRVAGISLAGKKGVIVREFSSFEQATTLDTVVIDKTGTITHGQWNLLKIIPTGAMSEEKALALAASLEQESEHFIAKELRNSAKQAGLDLAKPAGVAISENGISGYVKDHAVKIGSAALVAEEIARLSSASPPLVGGVGGGGSAQVLASKYNKEAIGADPSHSLVYMAVDREISAIFVFGDEIKQEATQVIRELKAMGYKLHLVSGDGHDATKAVGQKVGIEECHGGLMPEDKAAFIRRVQGEGRHVAMVGDGINDAPALAQSDLGIGISSGNDLGKEAGCITLMRGDLTQTLDFITLATRVNRKVRQNLAISGLYNVIAIPIAMTGLLNPLIAVTAMLLSSLTVIGNTLLLVKRTR
jgi:heavy metal translocating P-type ATPase